MTVATMWSEQAVELAESMQALYRGDYERAALLAEKYTKAHPKVAAAWVLLARVEMAQGKYLAAYHQLREALRLEPRNVDTLYYLGQLANTLSQLEFQKLYAMAPDSARVHQLQAELYRVQENTAKAEEEYLAALKANPRSVEVLVALGDLARAGSRFNEALTYYSRAHEVDPRNYDSTYGLAACYHFRQEPEKAIQFFRQATSIDPDSAAARLALGDALLRSGQASAAITELKAALTLEPKMRQAYTLLGRAQQRLGQSREAEESFKKAEELIQSEMKSRESLLSAGDLLSGPPARSQDK